MSTENRERFFSLLRYAEELKQKADSVKRQTFYLTCVFALFAVIFVLAIWILIPNVDAVETSELDVRWTTAGTTWLTAVVLVLLIAVLLVVLIVVTRFLRLRERGKNLKHDLGHIAQLLHEFLPRELISSSWSALDQAEAKIRMARLPIGKGDQGDLAFAPQALQIASKEAEIPWKKMLVGATTITIFRPSQPVEKWLAEELPRLFDGDTEACIRVVVDRNTQTGMLNDAVPERFRKRILIRELESSSNWRHLRCYLFATKVVLSIPSDDNGPALIASKDTEFFEFAKRQMDQMWTRSEPIVAVRPTRD